MLLGAIVTAIAPVKTSLGFDLITNTLTGNLSAAKTAATDVGKDLKNTFSQLMGTSGFATQDDVLVGLVSDYNSALKLGEEEVTKFLGEQDKLIKQYPQLEAEIKRTTTENGRLAISTKQVGKTTLIGASGLKGFATAAKAVGKAVAVACVEMLAITAAFWAISKAAEIIHGLTFEGISESAEEAATELENTKSELESLNGELETTKSRINELRGQDHLTLTEQSELDNLEKQNELLERQIALKEKAYKESQKESNKENTKVLESALEDLPGEYGWYEARKESADYNYDNGYWDYDTYQEQLEEMKKGMNTYLDSMSEAFANIDTSTLDADQLETYNEALEQYVKYMVELDQMSKDEGLKYMLGGTEYDEFYAKMQEMADSGATARNEIAEVVGENAFRKASSELLQIKQNAQDARAELANMLNADNINHNVDLLDRVVIDAQKLKDAGYEDAGDGIATVFTQAETDSNGTTWVFTPILPNGEVLTQDELNQYIDQVMNGENIDADVVLGSFDSIEEADEFSISLHNLHEEMFALQSMSLSDIFSDEDIQKLKNKGVDVEQLWNDIVESGSLSGETLEEIFGSDVVDALNAVGYTAADVQEQIESMRNFTSWINSDAQAGLKQQMTDLAQSASTEINTSQLESALGDEVVKACEAAGYSIETLVKWINDLRETLHEGNIASATGDLKTVETELDALSEAYYEFKENSGKVDASTLAGLAETFDGISGTEEFENFIKVLGDSSSTISQVDAALDKLVDRYFDTQIQLGNLTDANKDLYVAQLKQMGVSNAQQVVETKLAVATINSTNSTEEAKQKAYQLIAALGTEEGALYNTVAASLTAAQNLQILRIQMELTKSADFTGTMSKNIDAIIALGKAAGANGQYLVEYAEILAQIAQIETTISKALANGDIMAARGAGSAAASLKRKAASLKSLAESQFNTLASSVNTTVDYKPVNTGSSSSSGSGSSSTKDKNKEAYDAAKEKLDYQLEMNQISYSKYYKKLVKLGNKYFKKNTENMREHYKTLADVRRDAFDDAKSKLDTQLENGEISIEKYYTKLQAAMKKWYAGRKSNAEDYAEAEEELQKQIADAWDDRISKQETEIERITLEEVWPEGKTELDYWLAQMEALQKQYRKGMFKDKEAYLEIYYTLLEKIKDAEKELAQKQLDEVTEKIEAIDDLVDMVSDMLKQRIEDEIDALEDMEDAYSKILEDKKKSLELTKEEASYQEEIAEMNEELTKLQAQAELLKLDTSRSGRAKYAELLEEIKEKQQEISDSQADHTYDATIDALDEADEKYQEYIQDKIDALNEKMENQGEWLRYVYSYIESTKPSQLLSELKAYNYKYGDGINQTVDKIWNKYEQYADTVYGNTGYLAEILSELRDLEITYQAQVDAIEANDDNSYPDANAAVDIHTASKQSNMKNNTDTQNQTILQQVKAEYGGNWWYDPNKKNIYQGTGDSRNVSASAYKYIQEMKDINNNSALSKTERKKQLDAKLAILKTYYGYTNAHLTAAKNGKYNLWRTAGKKSEYQIFHDGIYAGYTGEGYVPSTKQNELLALLKKGELVFNQDNQGRLLTQLQAVNAFKEAFSGINPNSINQNNYGGSPIDVGGIIIQINGDATQDTINALRKEAENISNMTMTKLQSAMVSKGYATGASRGTFKR